MTRLRNTFLHARMERFADRLIYPLTLYLFTLLLLYTIRVFVVATEEALK